MCSFTSESKPFLPPRGTSTGLGSNGRLRSEPFDYEAIYHQPTVERHAISSTFIDGVLRIEGKMLHPVLECRAIKLGMSGKSTSVMA